MNAIIDELDKRILEAKKFNKAEQIDNLISSNFVFRNESEKSNDKKGFMKYEKARKYLLAENVSRQEISMTDESYCTVSIIRATVGSGGKTVFNGLFREIHFFRKEENIWQIYAMLIMKISDADKIKDEVPDQYSAVPGGNDKFTGKVLVEKIYEQGLPEGMKCQKVYFNPMARTRWHIHPEIQDLIIVSGEALVVTKDTSGKDNIRKLLHGEQIRIEPGLLHWHGATPHKYMMHLAYNIYSASEETTYWFDEVDDKKYLKSDPDTK